MSASTPLATPKAAGDAAGTALAAQRCENCGNCVAQQYCGACGQRLEPPVHSLVHFSKLAAEDLTHADSRLWRTLAALLFRPGFLTAEFLAGRRARYLPPLRLYLVLSVVFFVSAASTQTGSGVLQVAADDPSPARGGSTELSKPGETAQQRAERLCRDIVYEGPWQQQLSQALPKACRKIVGDDPRQLQESFLHNVPRAMFIFLPLIAAFMMLLYWRPRRFYVEHLLLLVHNHAFVFVAVMFAWLVAKIVPLIASLAEFALWVYFVWYMFRAMRVVYGQSGLLTFSKLSVIALFYLICGAAMLALTTVYSALML